MSTNPTPRANPTPRYPEPGSLSHGTLRTQDLGPAFASALAQWAPELLTNPEDPAQTYVDVDWEDPKSESLMDDLFEALDSISPPGHIFAAHPGDGSDFGWWPTTLFGPTG